MFVASLLNLLVILFSFLTLIILNYSNKDRRLDAVISFPSLFFLFGTFSDLRYSTFSFFFFFY